MKPKSIRRVFVVFLAVLLAGLFLVDSNAQRRRRRTRPRRSSTPRITNPAIYEPPASDNANENSNSSTSETTTNEDPQAKTIRDLSSQVNQMSNKINQMEQSQRTLVDLERLSRAEQRSADLWKQLRDVEAQQSDLQARAEEIDYALKPENIERAVAGYGSTHPEEVREQRRKQLESEKARVQKQLDQLAANHAHLETAIAGADAEVERLKSRLDAAEKAALENSKTATQSQGASPTATPSPSPK